MLSWTELARKLVSELIVLGAVSVTQSVRRSFQVDRSASPQRQCCVIASKSQNFSVTPHILPPSGTHTPTSRVDLQGSTTRDKEDMAKLLAPRRHGDGSVENGSRLPRWILAPLTSNLALDDCFDDHRLNSPRCSIQRDDRPAPAPAMAGPTRLRGLLRLVSSRLFTVHDIKNHYPPRRPPT